MRKTKRERIDSRNQKKHSIQSQNIKSEEKQKSKVGLQKFDKKSKLKQEEMMPPDLFLFLCLADLEKISKDIEIEFLLVREGNILLEPLSVFKELPPRAVSLYPFTKLLRDRSLLFSIIISSSKIYCVGGAAPVDCVTGHFRTLTNYSEYKSVNRSKLYCYDSNDDVDRFHLFKPSREVYVSDLSEPNQALKWMPLPPMSIGRCQPFILSLRGRIYVFGCRLTPIKDLHPFAEVFDPSTDQWTTLIDSVPPLNEPATTNCVFVENQTKVLVILTEEDISFTWPIEIPEIPIDYPIRYSCCPFVFSTDRIVVVEDIAFVFVNTQELYAYRLKNGMFCGYDQSPEEPTLVKGFEILDSPTYPSFFFHVGGMQFCLLWQQLNPGRIFSLRFHIVKNGNSLEDMSAMVDRCSSCSNEGNNSLLSASNLMYLLLLSIFSISIKYLKSWSHHFLVLINWTKM